MRVELFPFAHVFRPGSRIRVTVEAPGGNRPFWTFADLPADGVVVNEIGHSVGHASRVVLPVIPGVDAPNALPACPSLRGQPCRTAYGNATPVKVSAEADAGSDLSSRAGGGSVDVSWKAPPASRPGHTVAGYTVTELPGGAVERVTARATAARFDSLSMGAHWFVVEAEYSQGGGSGRSTPSNSVVLEKSSASTTTSTAVATTTTGVPVTGAGSTTSLPAVSTTSGVATTTSVATTAGATTTVSGGPGGLLPRTGSDAANLLAVAVALIGGSALLLMRPGRTRRDGAGR